MGMEFKCSRPGCNLTYQWSGHGRASVLCPACRKERDKIRIAEYTKMKKKEKLDMLINNPNETIIRPLESYRFAGPGLFEPITKLINRAIAAKSHALGMSKSWIINNWLPGQAGQQFVRSFMRPGM